MLEQMLAKQEYEERVCRGIEAYRFSKIGSPNRLSMVLKSLVSLLARF